MEFLTFGDPVFGVLALRRSLTFFSATAHLHGSEPRVLDAIIGM